MSNRPLLGQIDLDMVGWILEQQGMLAGDGTINPRCTVDHTVKRPVTIGGHVRQHARLTVGAAENRNRPAATGRGEAPGYALANGGTV